MTEFSLYPEKPILVRKTTESNWGLTVFTIVLFIAVFLSFYKDRADFVFLLVVVLLVHEFGHFFYMKRFKYENVRMLFVPMMGAFVQGNKSKYSQRESVFVALSGPIPGIALGALILLLSSYYHLNWLALLAFLFLFVNAVNLLPLDPLDGGQVLKVLLLQQHALYSIVFSLLSSLVLLFIGFLMSDWLIIAFGFLMGFRIRNMQVNYQMHKELKDLEVNYQVAYEDLSNRDYHVIKEVLISYRKTARMYAENPSDDSEQLMAHMVDELLFVPVEQDLSTLGKWAVVLLWLGFLGVPFVLYFTVDYYWYFETI